MESARLLLNSRSRLYPNGLGNRYGWVGRNLQGHAYTGAMGLFDHDIFDDLGPGASHRASATTTTATLAWLAAAHAVPTNSSGCRFSFSGMTPPDLPRWGPAHKDYMRKYFKRTIIIMGPVQEMPVFDARVQVDPTVKDYWGIPVARLSGHRHPHCWRDREICAAKAEHG